jgi:hypothetical protein
LGGRAPWLDGALPTGDGWLGKVYFFRRRPLSVALQFGFELGTGVRTYVPSAMPYVLALGLLLHLVPLLGAVAAGVGFGLGRAAMIWLRYQSLDRDRWDTLMSLRIRWISRLGSSVILMWAILLSMTEVA